MDELGAITMAFIAILESLLLLARAHNVTNICDLPGAWECKVDDKWYVACNGHDEEITVTPSNAMSVSIPPFHFAVWYNGWLAGLFHPCEGGMFVAGVEKALAAAVRVHIAALQL